MIKILNIIVIKRTKNHFRIKLETVLNLNERKNFNYFLNLSHFQLQDKFPHFLQKILFLLKILAKQNFSMKWGADPFGLGSIPLKKFGLKHFSKKDLLQKVKKEKMSRPYHFKKFDFLKGIPLQKSNFLKS